ncbi:MAG TPA: hypothetical protein VGC66_13635 [Pyrinomonadaceae bacterium]|jgi:hypothetical protein
MKKLTLSAFLILFLLGFYGSSVGQKTSNKKERIFYNSYANARFLYSIEYPAGILIPQREADNRDGRQFLSRDGHAKMMVFGRYALDTDTLQHEYEDALKGEVDTGRVVALKKLKDNWFVLSGSGNEKIFYRKTIYTGGAFKTFIIEYDESEKSFYDPITAHIAKSFTA